MSTRITRAQAKSFKNRWAIANAVEIEELRSTPISKKFHQLSLLMLSAKTFGNRKRPARQESELRKRWMEIRRALDA